MAEQPVEVAVSEIKKLKVYDFYNYGTHAGMYWICFELKKGRVIEYSITDYELVKNIISFIKGMLPEVELNVDDRIKT